MYQAVGYRTGVIYAEGEYKHDVMRKLNEDFPYHTTRGRNNLATNKPVYPEVILIRRGE